MVDKIKTISKPGIALLALTLFGIFSYWLGFRTIVSLTPLYLLVVFGLFIYESKVQKTDIYVLAAAATIGYCAEVIGVNTGLIFGEYSYGNVLGPALFGVPLIIGLLWLLLCGSIWSLLPAKMGAKRIAVVSLAAVLYDIVLERYAVEFGLWKWMGAIPLSNYGGWVLVSAAIALVFHLSNTRIRPSHVARLLIPVHMFFFMSLLLLGK
jgi:bisanhydrobacterioruberin hydratase